MPDKTVEQIAAEFTTRLNATRGQSSGYPGDFEYCVTVSENKAEIALEDLAKKQSGTSVWRRPDPWGLAIVHEFENLLREKNLPLPKITLKITMREPTSSTQPHCEAFLRRLSYLAHTNLDLNFLLFIGKNEKALYTEEELADRKGKNEVIRGSDFKQRDGNDSPGRLEKDFQAYLYGGEFAKSASLQTEDGDRSNIRLALLGPDFAEGDKSKLGTLEREFPTGAFLSQVSSKTRVLPTWYVDLLTMNKHEQIAAIELKFHNNKNVATLEVLAQVLDYALFFHCYRDQLQPTLEKRIKCVDANCPVVTYFVSNMYHPRFKTICDHYTKGKLKIKFIQMGYMWE